MELTKLSECDVLAISTLISRNIAECIQDTDELDFIGDLFASIADNVQLVSGQRARIEAAKSSQSAQNSCT